MRVRTLADGARFGALIVGLLALTVVLDLWLGFAPGVGN